MWQSDSALDQSIGDMNWSSMQLLTAQQAANAQLQLQTQQNQAVQIAHMDDVRSLAESSQQRSFDHILIYDGTNKGRIFEWVERLEAACLQSKRDIDTAVLDKAGGNVRTCEDFSFCWFNIIQFIFLQTELSIETDKLLSTTIDFIRSEDNPRCCNLCSC